MTSKRLSSAEAQSRENSFRECPLATPPALANNVATTRAGNVFSYRLPISTTSSAAEWLSVSVNSSGGSPINNAQTLGNRYIAPTNQSPTYDEDGNLASDARWIYQWDGENRLISMETPQTTAVNVGVPAKNWVKNDRQSNST